MRRSKSDDPVPINSTVKLPDELRLRVQAAMSRDGFTVWSEFCRVALTEKCIKSEMKTQKPAA